MDKIKQYLALHEALVREKNELETRLTEINKVLSGRASVAAVAAVAAPAKVVRRGRRGRPRKAVAKRVAKVARKVAAPRKSGRGRRGNKLSLREAVLEVTKRGPLTKQEILDGVKKLGYRFQTKDPMNTLNVVLYTNKKYIKNYGGKFGPA